MQDVVKVFIDPPAITGYVDAGTTPFSVSFRLACNIQVFYVQNDVIGQNSFGWQFDAPAGSSPGVIYASLFAAIQTQAVNASFPIPGQGDIFCNVPTALSQIFIDIPSIA